MAEKKKVGFFQRLFGGVQPTPPAPEPTVEDDLVADIILDDIVEAAPLVLPPDQEIALEEALHEAGQTITPVAQAESEGVRKPAPTPAPEPTVADELVADIILDDIVEAAPLVLPPDQEIALEEALHEAGQLITPAAEAEAAGAQPTRTAPEPAVEDELVADILLDDVVEAAPLVLPPDQELALASALHDEGRTISPTPPAPEEPRPPVEPLPPLPPVEIPQPPEEIPELPVEVPERPVEVPPAPTAEAAGHELAGPPETTVDYIEEVEAALEEETQAVPAPEPVPQRKLGWFQRLASGLKRSSDQLTGGIAAVFTKKKLDEAMLEELEDLLLQSDFGLEMAATVTGALRRDRFDRDITPEEVRAVLAGEVAKVLDPVARPLAIDPGKKPFVVLMVGVNGSGKTTTIGKLSSLYRAQGKKVMLAAGDTFRAAAIEQLQVWGERTGAPVVAKPPGSDASGLAFEAVTRAKEEGVDLLIIDTAGRLQNRDELMSELEKIIRVIKKVDETAPHATLLTLDATTGQNALNQVEIFGKRAGVTGLVMTKLDGTARGGILVAIAQRFGLPVHFIGVGEGVDNIETFAAADFAAAIAGKH